MVTAFAEFMHRMTRGRNLLQTTYYKNRYSGSLSKPLRHVDEGEETVEHDDSDDLKFAPELI